MSVSMARPQEEKTLEKAIEIGAGSIYGKDRGPIKGNFWVGKYQSSIVISTLPQTYKTRPFSLVLYLRARPSSLTTNPFKFPRPRCCLNSTTHQSRTSGSTTSNGHELPSLPFWRPHLRLLDVQDPPCNDTFDDVQGTYKVFPFK